MTEPPQMPHDQPAAWNEGYRAGCASGYNTVGNPYFSYEKNIQAYQDDKLYADGWDSGYEHCKTRAEQNRSH